MNPVRSSQVARIIIVTGCLLPAVLFGRISLAGESSPESPLDWARLLVDKIQPQNTSYQHHDGFVQWKGEDGALQYESHTDCSGFLNALLERSFGLTPVDFEKWLGKRRPMAIQYFDAIVRQQNFLQISSVSDVLPGDVIAIRYPPGVNENTGHIMLIESLPVHHGASKPEVAGTEQWEVSVIDSSESGHGETDTRRRSNGTFRQGVGRGILRLYTKENGSIAGYAWSTFAKSVYYDQKTRRLVIGRLTLAPAPPHNKPGGLQSTGEP